MVTLEGEPEYRVVRDVEGPFRFRRWSPWRIGPEICRTCWRGCASDAARTRVRRSDTQRLVFRLRKMLGGHE